jgi:uncharacterized glyoxalase superfamily protein PhnB
MANAQVKPIPQDMHTLTPNLICANAPEAIDFYKRAFGAVETSRIVGQNGKLMHAMLRIGDSEWGFTRAMLASLVPAADYPGLADLAKRLEQTTPFLKYPSESRPPPIVAD